VVGEPAFFGAEALPGDTVPGMGVAGGETLPGETVEGRVLVGWEPLPADPPAGVTAVGEDTPAGDAVLGTAVVGAEVTSASAKPEVGLDAVGVGAVAAVTGSGARSRCSPTSPLRRRSPIF
jgi:hypothetical protein